MTLTARVRRGVPAGESELMVACPQRVEPVALRVCASCELCQGLELDGHVGVHCAVEPEDGLDGSPGPGAAVATIMTADVISVEADASIENVQWLLVERGIGAVPVVDAQKRPIGILAKTDLLRDRDEPTPSAEAHGFAPIDPELSERATSGLTARDLMTPLVHAVLARGSIASAAAVMARERVHHVVIVDDAGRLTGIVSALDLARWVAARERFAPRSAS